MRPDSGWISQIRWQPAIALLAGIMLTFTLVLSPEGEALGQGFSDGGVPQGVASGLEHVPPAAPTFIVLHTFAGPDGANPYAGLIQDAAGNFYGTTVAGGFGDCANVYPYGPGCGVVFKLSPSGTETVLHNFTGGADGANPYAGLIQDAAGNFYGTTVYGGASGWGVVFKLSPTGTETVLYSFTGAADGTNPLAGLVRDAEGNLYGTAYGGNPTCPSPYGCGVVFKLTP